MSKVCLSGIRIVGISTTVPEKIFDNQKDCQNFSPVEVKKVVSMAGIKRRRIATESICSSDLCLQATRNLLKEINWPTDSIDALIFVTQTPDYFLPSTSCLIHRDLELPDHCASFDVGLGCSGYPYGLWLGSMLIQTGSAKRVLLLHGETPSRFTHADDRSTFLLFGDAGSATALEFSDTNEPWGFCLHTDGKGYDNLIIPGGGFRNRLANDPRDNFLHMNGADLFSFTVQRVPELINETLELMQLTQDEFAGFIFHQSNQFIMRHIAKKCALDTDKVPMILDEFGNAGGPSVPLALTQLYKNQVPEKPSRLMLLGYGVGLSWGSAAVTVDAELAISHSEYS